jgi:hypothetical protein
VQSLLEVTASLQPSKVADQWNDSSVSSFMGMGSFYFGRNKIERWQQSIVFHTSAPLDPLSCMINDMHQVAIICFMG